MIALWVVQGIVNLILFGFVVSILIQKRDQRASEMQSLTRVMETRLQAVEAEAQHYRKTVDAQLKRLSSICDQASEIMSRGFFTDVNQGPTQEETDLKAALSSPEPLHIPTIEQLERTKARLKNEMQIDLKTLLQDQLS